MARLDEVREILNTLRIWLSLTIGVIVVVAGGLIARYDKGLVDGLFYSGFFALFVLFLVVLLIVLKISSKTKEIKEL
ncbi:MAG: hypothetical protein RI556_07170 [Hydrogenovibrio sp.]|uniref:hypothetical protein n=1 Tax=Hydrogenovibrio sp. TaxID=2065821 RepID=UPI002870536C|nr:hypothetical protein [Hydrogenovibrio sp.]MDR9498938.1 hypothetical protein [Hydrogenovibrio sp.]